MYSHINFGCSHTNSGRSLNLGIRLDGYLGVSTYILGAATQILDVATSILGVATQFLGIATILEAD